MTMLVDKAKELLSSGTANLFVGYTKTPEGRTKAAFIDKPEMADKLIYDDSCLQNLAVYLNKNEVKAFGKVAIFASPNTLKTILRLAGENQLVEGQYIVIGEDKGKIIQFEKFAEIEAFLNALPVVEKKDMDAKLEKVMAMSSEDRWDYWVSELENCIKCYACRSVCPMCYCTQCITDMNAPQWIPVSSHGLGNLEWHITRAMHLAGRCVECDACATACPMDIPLNLLTKKLNNDIEEMFGKEGGFSAKTEYVLSHYKFEDKDKFIR